MRQTIINTLPPRNSPLTKDELLNGLNNVLNAFLYGFVCPKLVPPERWKDVSSKTALFGDVEVQLGPLTRRAFEVDYTLREGFKRNYENCLLRALLREAHELILWYCEEVMSHKEGGTLREWPKDLLRKGITSVSWHGKTLDTTMLGHRIVFYPPEGLKLINDQIEFVTNKLS